MRIYTFGLAEVPASLTLSALMRPPRGAGLIHAECMTLMELGAPILSAGRMQLSHLCMFAAWENEGAIDNFFEGSRLGSAFLAGWHLRMSYLRRWGSVREFDDLPPEEAGDPLAPVAAYTLARLRIPEVPRFIQWGRPVEEQVRDHPETTLALAAIRYPRSVATFSIWNSQKAMTDMVSGRSSEAGGERQAAAMRERERRNFHREFTTLRFRPLSEHGAWKGQTAFVRPIDQPTKKS